MRAGLAALVVHDLKNQLGVLEAQLAALAAEPDRASAAEAHQRCVAMRRRFVTFLTLYGAGGDDAGGGEMRALCDDESPRAMLESLCRTPPPAGVAPVRLGDCTQAPAFWFFDVRLVRMALDAALHNAWRFARHGIVVGAYHVPGFLVFTVDDDGPGIGHGSGHGSDFDGATGLGTALCAAVARAHHCKQRVGRVVLGNRPEGGARFELWLA